MTDRVAALVVTFADNIREDDSGLHAIRTVLEMVDGIVSIEPIGADINYHIAHERARHDLEFRLLEVLRA